MTKNTMTKKTFACVVGCCMVAGIGRTAEYAYDSSAANRTLFVTVAAGSEEDLDVSYLAPAGANVTNVVKRGDGTLVFKDTAIKNYQFDSRVEDGILKLYNKSTFSKTPCAIDVCDGATLYTMGGGSSWGDYSGLTTRFCGNGHNGMGALYRTDYDQGKPFGGTVTQTGDARVKMLGTSHTLSLDMQRHQLDLYFNASLNMMYNSFANIGELNLFGTSADVNRFAVVNPTEFQFDEDSSMSLSNVIFSLCKDAYKSAVCSTAPLTFKAGSSLELQSGAKYVEGGTQHRWSGPVRIDEPVLPVYARDNATTDVGFAFTNSVSGGGMAIAGNASQTLTLTLCSPDNSFTGGVSAVNAVLRAKVPGSVPSLGGALAFTNSTFAADDAAGTYALPSASFEGNCTVDKGYGQWRGALTKTGAGTLDYRSSIGADILDVRGGSVDFSSQAERRRMALAGAIEGRQRIVGEYADFKDAPWADNPSSYNMMYYWVYKRTRPVFTNCVTRGFRMLYDTTHNYETGWTSNLVVTYSGYLWNNSTTNELWAFAAQSASDWVFHVDGNFVFGYCDWSGSYHFDPNGGQQRVSTNTYLMAPGPHYFEYRTYVRCRANSFMGPEMPVAAVEEAEYAAGIARWEKGCGLMFNRSGRCTKKSADYQQLVDPGDGSLITCALPSSAPVQIGTTVLPSWRAAFTEVKFAPGTSADFGGLCQSFSHATGWPTVTHGDMTVNDTWSFDPLEVGTTSFAINGKLSLGPDMKVVFTGAAKPQRPYRRQEITLGTASAGIVGSVKTVEGEGWRVYVDGNAIKAFYSGSGTVLIIR